MAVPPFTLNLAPLSDSLLELSRVELRETPEIREKAIKELRQLLHAATDLHYRDDDDFLLIFLRPCHFYPESALKMVSWPKWKKINHYKTIWCKLQCSWDFLCER